MRILFISLLFMLSFSSYAQEIQIHYALTNSSLMGLIKNSKGIKSEMEQLKTAASTHGLIITEKNNSTEKDLIAAMNNANVIEKKKIIKKILKKIL